MYITECEFYLSAERGRERGGREREESEGGALGIKKGAMRGRRQRGWGGRAKGDRVVVVTEAESEKGKEAGRWRGRRGREKKGRRQKEREERQRGT